MSFKKKVANLMASMEQKSTDVVVIGRLTPSDKTDIEKMMTLYEQGQTLNSVIEDLTKDLKKLTEVFSRSEFRLSEKLRQRLHIPDDAGEVDFSLSTDDEVCIPRTTASKLGLDYVEFGERI